MQPKLCIRASASALLIALAPPAARAVIVYDQPSGLTTAPADGQGFSFVGQWGNGVGSGVAIAPQWLITAQHFTNGSNQFILNGTTYTRDLPLVDIPGTDLRLVHVSGTFPAWAPLLRRNDGFESGKLISVVGFGFRQHAVAPDVTTGPTQNGFLWSGDAVTRSRGHNLVGGFATVNGFQAMHYDFDATNGAEEAGLAEHDSGGGAFVLEDGEWKLAGVHLGTQLYKRNAGDTDFIQASIFNSAGLFQGNGADAPGGPALSFSSRIAPFLTQIDAATNNTAASTRYWDINGTTAGAGGGAAPAGNWNGTAVNFNTDPTGGAAGALSAVPTSVDTVVFAAGANATGSYTVTVSGTRSAGKLSFTEGNVTVTGGTLAVPAFDVSSGVTGTVTSSVAAPGNTLTKSGLGTLRVTRLPQSHAVNITGGMLRVLESSPGLGSGHPSGNNASVSLPSSVTISNGATLDLTNNDLVIDYSGASPVVAYEALVASGYNITGDWQGDGITSSIAAVDGNYVLAIADNALLAAPFGTAQGGPLFAGVNVDLTTVLIKFTHRADINLDGVVTPDDSAIFGGNYDESITSGHTWALGDMNYDGMCTPDDAAIFGGAYDEALLSLPEPSATLTLLALAAVATRRRPRVQPSRRERLLTDQTSPHL